MSEVLELTDERLAEALRGCTKREVTVCRKCPVKGCAEDGKACCDTMMLMAAERIGALAEENRRLKGIVDGFASKVEEQMVWIARECNGAGGQRGCGPGGGAESDAGGAGGDGPGMRGTCGAGGRRMADRLDPGRGPGDLQKGGWT